MQTANHQDRCSQQYILAGHWLSDVNFFENEIHFFSKLLDQHILFCEEDTDAPWLLKLAKDLRAFKKDNEALYVYIINHLQELELEMKQTIRVIAPELDRGHGQLQRQVAVFVAEYKKYKQHLFDVVTAMRPHNEVHVF